MKKLKRDLREQFKTLIDGDGLIGIAMILLREDGGCQAVFLGDRNADPRPLLVGGLQSLENPDRTVMPSSKREVN